MAEQVHNYLRTGIILAAIIFAGGGYAMKINGNSGAIVSNSDKIEKVAGDVHRIELNAKDTHALAAKAAEAMISIDSKFSDIQTKLNDQAIVQGVNSAKLKTLTKD